MPVSIDIQMLYAALNVAKASRLNGNLPLGCVLPDENGTILLKGENTVLTKKMT